MHKIAAVLSCVACQIFGRRQLKSIAIHYPDEVERSRGILTPLTAFASTSPQKKKKTSSPRSGGGFGAPTAKTLKLDAKAKKLLQEMGGNVEAAEEQQFQNLIKQLEKKDPEMFETLMASEGGQPTGEAYTKLVELFWDAVGTYLPARKRETGDGMSAEMRAKVSVIASCATAGGPAILDVGCGDGTFLPHLLKAGAKAQSYLGLDVSARMIDAAKIKHPQGVYRHSNFLSEQPTATYDCVLLNGAAQYFADQRALLSAATAWLRPGGRVVLAHAQGAAFVASQHSGNPAVVRSCMPGAEQLTALAAELELELLSAEECVPKKVGENPHTLEGEDFYLVALKKAGGE